MVKALEALPYLIFTIYYIFFIDRETGANKLLRSHNMTEMGLRSIFSDYKVPKEYTILPK